MAVMLRTLGVPTRNVTGFIGGTYNRFARSYAVRQGDAHSWVEVYLDDTGWTRFDPTPPASAAPQSDITGLLAFVRDFVEATTQRWNRHVIGYDLKQQVGLLRSVHRSYSALRDRPGTVGKLLSSPRATLLGHRRPACSRCTRAVWFSRRRKTLSPAARAATERETAAREIVELYRQLEAALASARRGAAHRDPAARPRPGPAGTGSPRRRRGAGSDRAVHRCPLWRGHAQRRRASRLRAPGSRAARAASRLRTRRRLDDRGPTRRSGSGRASGEARFARNRREL